MKAKRNLVDKLRPDHIVYGPYIRTKGTDVGRSIVILYKDKKSKTISYPKWLMEQHLERFLSTDETVDHKDYDVTNNTIENLQILSRAEHARLDVTRNKNNTHRVICCWCKKAFTISRSSLLANKSKNKAGPFCSKHCSGLYGSELRKGQQEKLPSAVIEDNEKIKLKEMLGPVSQKQRKRT